MPFQIEPGDFVMSNRLDGPSCWVCLGDDEKTDTFVKVVKANPSWKYRSSGQVNVKARSLFGLAPEPGAYLAGIPHQRANVRFVAQAE